MQWVGAAGLWCMREACQLPTCPNLPELVWFPEGIGGLLVADWMVGEAEVVGRLAGWVPVLVP